ncbi:mevalonyl-CoA ligase [Microdochium nivale]|nr:mevalonyl-CoA ligase [Microdochium nivale]
MLRGARATVPRACHRQQLSFLAWRRARREAPCLTWSAYRRSMATAAPRLSFVEGPNEPPLLTQTIPDHFASIVSQHGDRPAVIARAPAQEALGTVSSPETATLTYNALHALSNSLAHSLRSLGVKKGDRVAVSLGNVCENVALSYATFKLGAILVPLNPSFNAQQMTAALAHLRAEILVIGAVTDLAYKPCRGRSNLDLLTALVPNLRGPNLESPSVPSLKNIVVLDNSPSHPQSNFPLEELRCLTPYSMLLDGPSSQSPSKQRSVVPDSPLEADDIINIQFTSGTTSSPKAAMLSHTSILNNGRLIADRMGLVPDDKIVCPPPLFHCFGCVLGLQATATTGAAILFGSPAFDPAATLRMISEHRATGLYGVATMFVAELELLANPAFATTVAPGSFEGLRKGIAAGSSVPEALMRRLFDKLSLHDLVICYGMTETSPVSCMTGPRDPLDKRTGSVGRAMPHTQVKIVSPHDRSEIVPLGERGELAVSGYLVMEGYFDDPERTKIDRIPDDSDGDSKGKVWMYSGDEAAMDEDGFVSITGRIKDLIIRGGENIHPLEIENCLFQHPLVQEVSVVGVPDERHGEAVAAFIVPCRGVRTADDDAGGGGAVDKDDGGGLLTKKFVRDWVASNLSGHLVPKHVFWVQEYPKTASGKIQKFKLRDMAKELMSSSSSSS